MKEGVRGGGNGCGERRWGGVGEGRWGEGRMDVGKRRT